MTIIFQSAHLSGDLIPGLQKPILSCAQAVVLNKLSCLFRWARLMVFSLRHLGKLITFTHLCSSYTFISTVCELSGVSIHDDRENQPISPLTDSTGRPLTTHHIQRRKPSQPRMAPTTPTPPRQPVTIPRRTLPVSHRQTRNNKPQSPHNRRHRNRQNSSNPAVRDRYPAHR